MADNLHARVERAREWLRQWLNNHPEQSVLPDIGTFQVVAKMLADFALTENKELLAENANWQDKYLAETIRADELKAERDRLRDENRWIAVGEKPKISGEYIVVFASGVVSKEHFDASRKKWGPTINSDYNITHWRALPAPPSVEKEK